MGLAAGPIAAASTEVLTSGSPGTRLSHRLMYHPLCVLQKGSKGQVVYGWRNGHGVWEDLISTP